MARLPRFILPGYPQHIIVRGNNREPVFASADDYRYYLEKLVNGASKHECHIHAYVLMTNHIHLLITPMKAESISKLMQYIGRYYVQYFNHEYQRTGTLWEGRYKATLIDSESYLLTCQRYIEHNPVRAGMVTEPSAYPWSSYFANAEGGDDPAVTPHALYLSLGGDNVARQQAYRELFKLRLSDKTLDQIREATNKSWVLGQAVFQEKVAGLLNRRLKAKAKGGDRRSKEFKQLAKATSPTQQQ
jgi:putative transposase